MIFFMKIYILLVKKTLYGLITFMITISLLISTFGISPGGADIVYRCNNEDINKNNSILAKLSPRHARRP